MSFCITNRLEFYVAISCILPARSHFILRRSYSSSYLREEFNTDLIHGYSSMRHCWGSSGLHDCLTRLDCTHNHHHGYSSKRRY